MGKGVGCVIVGKGYGVCDSEERAVPPTSTSQNQYKSLPFSVF